MLLAPEINQLSATQTFFRIFQMFSASVMITDLDDFIQPSQTCIKPIETTKTTNSTEILVSQGEYYQVEIDGSETKLEQASITLNDCLACSGCITSAESVLITMQSQDELYKILNQGTSHIVVSISSQSRASLAAKYGMNSHQIWTKLASYLKHLGVHEIFDIDFARDITLLESARCFMTKPNNDPIMASFCPGWVCYAEKTHKEMINLIDTTKSPQQVMGSLVKDYYAQMVGLNPNQIYHVTIMPCYDKKLEASRQDFYNDLYSVRDVDLVLSTLEIEQMILKDFETIANIPTTFDLSSVFVKGNNLELYSSEGSTSGGYLSFIMRYAVYHKFNIVITPQDIELGTNGISLHPGRNSDFLGVYYTRPGDKEPSLKFAYAFGFRNIQNLVRKLKMKKKTIQYDFIEVAACPKSCINGGGQVKLDNSVSIASSKEWLDAATQVYYSNGNRVAPENNEHVLKTLENWLGGLGTKKSNEMLHTRYHAVENTDNNLSVKW